MKICWKAFYPTSMQIDKMVYMLVKNNPIVTIPASWITTTDNNNYYCCYHNHLVTNLNENFLILQACNFEAIKRLCYLQNILGLLLRKQRMVKLKAEYKLQTDFHFSTKNTLVSAQSFCFCFSISQLYYKYNF